LPHIGHMRLATYMRRNNLLDADVARLIGRDRSTICRIRNGIQKPDWPTMIEFVRATGGAISPNDFLPIEHKL